MEPSRQRVHVRVRGTVQGVGFRPFVYREAVALGLVGCVGNDSAGVLIQAQGSVEAVGALVDVVRRRPPLLAVVEDVEVTPVALVADTAFRIVTSAQGPHVDARVSADVAPCAPCLAEMDDASDRRFGYPFINCTDCGPRYTIVRDVPYDRATTTMSAFQMCAVCQAEYDDPADRRFHAEPNACPECGPALAWSGPGGARAAGPDALASAVACLLAGGIVGVKGVGGYHLACLADDEQVVSQLRRRKQRDDKPFAVMVADVAGAHALCHLEAASAEGLVSPRRPILLAPTRAGAAVAAAVAPRLGELGIMLPSSPLHVLLLNAAGRPLVMTSGNGRDEPLAHDDSDARRRLGPLTEGLLSHDREIHVRADDSVVRTVPGGAAQLVRRARGWVPQPVRLPVAAREPLLAVGAQLKSTVAVARGGSAVVSQHLGDLDHWATFAAFSAAIDHLSRIGGVSPAWVVHDLHPEYRSTAWAQESGLELLGVQHHHAHIAACLAEHGVTSPVLGIVFDGLGLGTDGGLWGGELLLADLTGFERVAHLAPVPLPGGDAATREPWRVALSWVLRALGPEAAAALGPRLDERWPTVLSLAASGRSPETSSVGRLFDAVAALLGVRRTATYEGQAAAELEALARRSDGRSVPTYAFGCGAGVLDPGPMLAELLSDLERGTSRSTIAAGFHRGLAAGTARVAQEIARARGVDTVALSGGVFQNVLLSRLLSDALRGAGLRVLVHQHLPPNDGSISVGQLAIAAALLDAR